MVSRLGLIAVLTLSTVLLGGCSMRSLAVETVGDMLASDQSVFTGDDDVELIGEALPFSLKLVESLIAEAPEDRRLLLTAARGYVLYSYAYVDLPADRVASEDIGRARQLRGRARKLFLRAFDYALRGLEVDHPGLRAALDATPKDALQPVTGVGEDVPLLYWSASALGLAISVSKSDPAMLARLPEVEALLGRALELDEAWNDGALHEFALVLAAAVPSRRDRAAIERHYRRALALSQGRRASLYIAYAMAVAVPEQNRALFRELMDKALAVDPDAVPKRRLLEVIAQRQAAWLLSRSDELFLD